LTPDGPQTWHLGSAELKASCREAASWCAAQGVDIADLSMRFALAEPRIHVTLFGAKNAEEVQRNVRCVGVAPDAAAIAGVQRILTPVRDMAWPSGRAEYS